MEVDISYSQKVVFVDILATIFAFHQCRKLLVTKVEHVVSLDLPLVSAYRWVILISCKIEIDCCKIKMRLTN